MVVQFFHSSQDDKRLTSALPPAFLFLAGTFTMIALILLKAEYRSYNILVVNLVFVYLVQKYCKRLEMKIAGAGFNILQKVFEIILLSIAIILFINHWFI
ncbi:MAG: small neutral amino acid transporter SnatA (MarC family) [Paraglaciecola sp.]|jgi:small neutral amino acid transporter SnatA (MarC family)